MACPAAGASRTIEVGVAGPLELLDLAEHEDVLDARARRWPPRRGRRTTPAACEIRRQAVVAQVLEQGLVGGERAGPHLGRAVGPPPAESTASS